MKTQTVSPLNPSSSVDSVSKSGSDSIATAWCRLQALSCRHANVIYGQIPRKERQRLLKAHKGPPVPEDIAENCAILGRGDEAELKNRAYVTVLYDASDRFDAHYDFGAAYVASSSAIYNALPTRYWESGMSARMCAEYCVGVSNG